MLDLLSDASFDLAPWRWYQKVKEKGANDVSTMCKASPSFPHRRAPEYLNNLTSFHLAALFGKIDHAAALLEWGADKNAVGLYGETVLPNFDGVRDGQWAGHVYPCLPQAFGFVLERGVEAEIKYGI